MLIPRGASRNSKRGSGRHRSWGRGWPLPTNLAQMQCAVLDVSELLDIINGQLQMQCAVLDVSELLDIIIGQQITLASQLLCEGT